MSYVFFSSVKRRHSTYSFLQSTQLWMLEGFLWSHPSQRRERQLRDARGEEVIVFNDAATGEWVCLQWIASYTFPGERPWLKPVGEGKRGGTMKGIS